MIRWYTTAEPLRSFAGQLKLVDPGEKVWLVAEAQFHGPDIWKKGPGGPLRGYEVKRTDFTVRDPAGESVRAGASATAGSPDWVQGEHFTDNPTAGNSRLRLAFPVAKKYAEKGPFTIEYPGLPSFELPADRRTAGPAD